jgi:hypothetical protein
MTNNICCFVVQNGKGKLKYKKRTRRYQKWGGMSFKNDIRSTTKPEAVLKSSPLWNSAVGKNVLFGINFVPYIYSNFYLNASTFYWCSVYPLSKWGISQESRPNGLSFVAFTSCFTISEHTVRFLQNIIPEIKEKFSKTAILLSRSFLFKT